MNLLHLQHPQITTLIRHPCFNELKTLFMDVVQPLKQPFTVNSHVVISVCPHGKFFHNSQALRALIYYHLFINAWANRTAVRNGENLPDQLHQLKTWQFSKDSGSYGSESPDIVLHDQKAARLPGAPIGYSTCESFGLEKSAGCSTRKLVHRIA